MSMEATQWQAAQERVAGFKREVARVIVGQESIVEHMLTSLLCRGHVLIVGVPGLAKTLLVSTLGHVLGLSFRRIQFTPDLMPTDILGSEILQDGGGGRRQFEFVPGPVFANLILADEINRTPPKTQAALLEAMQEKQVTIAGRTMPLREPFIVFATQNPIEQEGTYPLPEAQLDRFLFNLVIDYPSPAEERQVVLQTMGFEEPRASRVLEEKDLVELQRFAMDVPVPDHVLDYALRLVHASRPASPEADETVRKYVAWGAGPRASQNFIRAARALALLRGQPSASIQEVRDLALPVLRHRLIPNYNATGEGITSDTLVKHLLDTVKTA